MKHSSYRSGPLAGKRICLTTEGIVLFLAAMQHTPPGTNVTAAAEEGGVIEKWSIFKHFFLREHRWEWQTNYLRGAEWWRGAPPPPPLWWRQLPGLCSALSTSHALHSCIIWELHVHQDSFLTCHESLFLYTWDQRFSGNVTKCIEPMCQTKNARNFSGSNTTCSSCDLYLCKRKLASPAWCCLYPLIHITQSIKSALQQYLWLQSTMT